MTACLNYCAPRHHDHSHPSCQRGCASAAARHPALHAPGTVAAARTAAALALCTPALVLEKMPVLRLQLARGTRRGRLARGALPRRLARRPGSGAAACLGSASTDGVHRRRHAQPFFAGIHRPVAGRYPGVAAARGGRRNHLGSQPRHLRKRPFSRLSRSWRDAFVGGGAKLQRYPFGGAGPCARRCPGPCRRRRGSAGFRHLQPRLDVRPAGARYGSARRRSGYRAGTCAPAPVDLPPHHRAQHRLCQISARGARGRSGLRHARPHHRTHCGCGAAAL